MKISIYTSKIKVDDNHTLLFNAYSGKFIALKDQSASLDISDISGIQQSNPLLFDQMKDSGMLVDDDIDEVAMLAELIEETANNDDEFILHINPTLDCNFDCWYCYENHIRGSKMDFGILKATKQLITDIVKSEKVKKFHLGFFGGEPLFYFKDIAAVLVEHTDTECNQYETDFTVSFTSNGGLLTEKIIAFLANYNCSFQITLDGGRTDHDNTRFFRDKSGSFDRIVTNVISLADNRIHVLVRVNYTSKNIESVNGILDSFSDNKDTSKKYISFDFQRVWQDRSNKRDETEIIIDKIRTDFRESGFVVMENYLLQNIRNCCYGDKNNYLLVNYDGNLFGCTARDFTLQNAIGKLSEAGETEFFDRIIEKRDKSKFCKPICRKCRIAPICGGGCKQKSYETSDNENCIYDYSQEDIDNKILDIFENQFLRDA